MSNMCCSSDPSCPVSPGGLSRILEWSLQGGAVVMSMMWNVDLPYVSHKCVIDVECLFEVVYASWVCFPPKGV